MSVVDKVVDRRGTREVATGYLKFLYSPAAQDIAARNHYRPRNGAVIAKYPGEFKKIPLSTIDDTFGGWRKAQLIHFADGGVFDQISKPS